jgi:predicted nucleic acid-binding protein
LNAPGSLFDTSVWIALSFAAHPLHAPARAAFLAASPANRALFCRATQQSVHRILSTPAIVKAYGVPTHNRDALAILDRLRRMDPTIKTGTSRPSAAAFR